jgi:hypothetical protein
MPKDYNLGDVIIQGDYFFQAVAVEDPAKPGVLYQEESGKRLVAVDVIIGNVNGSADSFNPLSAVLLDDEGYAYRPDLGGRDGQLSLIEVNPGERVRGWISFVVPDNAKLRSLKYDFNGDTIKAGLTGGEGQAPADLPERTPPTLSKLGDVVEQDGYSLTAITVEDPAKPGMFFTAVKGMRLVAVEIVIANVSGEQINTNPLYSTMVDGNGFLYGAEMMGRNGQMEMVELNKGEKVKGWVSFLIPSDATLEGIKFNMAGNITLETGLAK